MDINVFVIIRREEYKLMTDLEKLVDEVNEHFGGDGPTALFDWCDIFKGGDHLLTIEEAKAFPDEAAPCHIIHKLQPNGEWWRVGSEPTQNLGWRNILDVFKFLPEDLQVLFLKARI